MLAMRLLRVVLVLTLSITVGFSSLISGASSEITEIEFYLTDQREAFPYAQYLLKLEAPTSGSPKRINHPNNFIWRTDFQTEELNFSSGQWNFNLWLKTNESTSCKLSFGLFSSFLGYVPFITQFFPLEPSETRKYTFTFNDIPEFTIPEGDCYAFQLNASSANLYVDSTDTPSNIVFSPQTTTTTTTETETETETTTETTLIPEETETTTTGTNTTETMTSETTITSQTENQTTSTEALSVMEHSTITVHAHPTEFQYPVEPPSEIVVSVLAEYIIDGVKNTETKETLFTLEVDRGSFVNLTVTSLPQNHTWVEWDNYGAGRTTGTKVTIYVDSDRNIIGYLSRNATSFVGPQIIVIPGFTNESIIIGFLFAVTLIYFLRVNRKK